MKCSVDDCQNEANRVGARMCEKHYMRMRRRGSTDRLTFRKEGDLTHNGGDYLLTYAPDHPLRSPGSCRVYAHRIAYYERHGQGPFNCFHCGQMVTWATMHVDHLDDNPQNNSPENLAASCPKCNQRRGLAKMRRAMQERGLMIEFNGERLHIGVWAERLGISRVSLKGRLARWPLEKALTAPRGRTGPKKSS